MKKKVILLITLITLLISQFLPVSSIFAVDDIDKKPHVSLSVSDDANKFGKNARIGSGEVLTFVAKITDTHSAPEGENVTWSYDLGGGIQTAQTTINNNKEASFTLDYSAISMIPENTDYVMTATYNDNGTNIEGRAKFGIKGENPGVVFMEPSFEEKFSVNDPIHLKIKEYKGTESTSLTRSWICAGDAKISAGYFCPSNNDTEKEIAYRETGSYNITVRVEDNDGKIGTATITIEVVSDPPKIEIVSTDKNPNEYKINDVAKIKVLAKDLYGTIKKLEWGCGNDANAISFDFEKVFDPSAAKTNYDIEVLLPDVETDNYSCKIRAIDDDGESGVVSAAFKVSLPSVPDDDSSDENRSETVSPNTGVMTKENDFVNEDAVIVMGVSVVFGIFILVAKSVLSGMVE